MPSIFISSRRNNGPTTITANEIFDRLKNTYRKDQVSNDIGVTATTSNLRQSIASKVGKYSLLLTIIGPAWLESSGRRPLDDENDIIRLELEEAHRAGLPVLPVLVRSATMPAQDQLPPTLQYLGGLTMIGSEVAQFTTSDQFNKEMRQLYRIIGQKLETHLSVPENEVPTDLALDDPDQQRKMDLNTTLEMNKRQGHNPFFSIRVRTRGELQWLIERQRVSGSLNPNAAPHPDLRGADLSFVNLTGIQLAHADMRATKLHRTNLAGANLEGANLSGLNLEFTNLKGVNLQQATLKGAIFSQTILESATLRGANLEQANLHGADLAQMNDLQGVCFKGADLGEVLAQQKDLSNVDFTDAHIDNADFTRANLTDADLSNVHCVGLDLSGADLGGAKIDSYDLLKQVSISKKTKLAFAAWNNVRARPYKGMKGKERLQGLRDAVRVNHQVSKALADQGLLSLASEYRLREQRMQRKVLWSEHRLGAWLFSWLLNLVAGYGERLGRTVTVYVATVLGFAGLYFALTNYAIVRSAPMTWHEVLIFSIGSFHGRSLIQSAVGLNDPLAVVAAGEALVGLFIELIFIAAFSRRFLGNN